MDMDMDRQANSLVNKYAFAISKFSPWLGFSFRTGVL
jgi:hypothetical protein